MSFVRAQMASIPVKLTARQQEVLHYRYARGASEEEIAFWLNISRRAVSYRLRNARRRLGCLPEKRIRRGRSRWWAASQFATLAEMTQDIDCF